MELIIFSNIYNNIIIDGNWVHSSGAFGSCRMVVLAIKAQVHDVWQHIPTGAILI